MPLPGKPGRAYGPAAVTHCTIINDGPDGQISALILAAGRGERAGGGIPKQYRHVGGRPLVAHAVSAFLAHPLINHVHLVVSAEHEDMARAALGSDLARITTGHGGRTRQESVRLGLEALASFQPDQVLIHDAARPLVPHSMIDRVLSALEEAPGACPALPVVDSLRQGADWLDGEVPRDGIWRVQTPQGFRFNEIYSAHQSADEGATDDAEVLRRAGHKVRLVEGDPRAMKITLPQDFDFAEHLMPYVTVTGSGYDVHRFGEGDHIWLCGVQIPYSEGLQGHSDADVGLHALTDALLGALGAGDIGSHFPPSDDRWRGAASDIFLKHAADLVADAGGRVVHCDVTLIAEAPKIGPHRDAMVKRIGQILSAHAPRVSVKATTTEKLGFTGRKEGIAAQAVATVRLPCWDIK